MPADPSFMTSSDVSAGDDVLATQYNNLRNDIKQARLPVMFMVTKRDGIYATANFGVYSDDFDYWIYQSGATTVRVKDMRSGGDHEDYDITADWADADAIAGIAKKGSYVYICATDVATSMSRVYRYSATDLAAGGTLMTNGTIGDGTSIVDLMICDGTALYFNNNGGDTAVSSHIWEKYTISDVTLTYDSDITCGAADANFTYACMDHSSNFYGGNSVDDKVRRYNSAGTLQATETTAHSAVETLWCFEGHPYLSYRDGANTEAQFHKMTLLP